MHLTESHSTASVVLAKFINSGRRFRCELVLVALIALTTSCCCTSASRSKGFAANASSDPRLENTILAFVSADGRTSRLVKGHNLIGSRFEKRHQRTRTSVYSTSKELYQELRRISFVKGDQIVFTGACQSIQNQYPGCTDIQDPGPGVTWRKDMYSYFHHCVPDSTTTNTCTATWTQVGTSYFYPTQRQCELNVGAIKANPIMDYYCESR